MQKTQIKFNLYYTAYLVLGIIWGTNFLFMKWAAVYITPLQIVFLRVLAGFIPVFIYALIKRQIKLSHIKYIHHFFINVFSRNDYLLLLFCKRNSVARIWDCRCIKRIDTNFFYHNNFSFLKRRESNDE